MRRSSSTAFTLVELIVAMAIILTLAALTTTVVIQAKGRGKQTACAAQMRQIYMALDLYCTDGDGWERPPLCLWQTAAYSGDKALYRCPAEDDVKPGANGLWPAAVFNGDVGWSDLRISYPYLKSFLPEPDFFRSWDRSRELPNAGVVACIWHGNRVGRPSQAGGGMWVQKVEGTAQRVCFDGHLFTWRLKLPPNVIFGVTETFYGGAK